MSIAAVQNRSSSGPAISPAPSYLDTSPSAAAALENTLQRKREHLLVRKARSGDRAAQQELIDSHLRLIHRIAGRYRCRSLTLDDLVQEGIVGFLHAVERFDETRGCRLSTYAVHWIRQSIVRAVEQLDRLIHIPLQATADLRRIDQARRSGGSRAATDDCLARASGLSAERVGQLLNAADEVVSFEVLVGPDRDTSLLDMAVDAVAPDPEQQALRQAECSQVRRLLGVLAARERAVISARFGLNEEHPMTLEEVSRRMHVSRERVRQIELRAFQKLRRALRATNWD